MHAETINFLDTIFLPPREKPDSKAFCLALFFFFKACATTGLGESYLSIFSFLVLLRRFAILILELVLAI
jgi:hypothetical protein